MSNKLYLIYPESSESGTLETLPETNEIILLKDSEMIASDIEFQSHDKVCITSEASLDLVKEKITDLNKKEAIDLLKDKFKFRKILTEIYPDYQFKKIEFSDIEHLVINKKTVLKPQLGCFGTAVKIIDETSNLKSISHEIKNELEKNSSVLSENVLSQNSFILEDYIDGEEYAVDMFYDDKGDPHIVNIYYHPIPKIDSYLHMIYYTNKSVFDKIHDKAMVFFKKLNAILKVSNLVLHSEFKLDKELVPIEINAMRFGGMGLGNMAYHSLGVNPYHFYNIGSSPNWKDIWDKNPNEIFAFFIAYNGSRVDTTKQEPDINKLKKQFNEVLHEQLFDYKTQLAFGVFCLKESTENINKLLEIDFNDYFHAISS